jgi:hypothetical protein
MSFLEDTKKRVHALLEEAAHLAESEFPYPGSRTALEKLIQFFAARLATLNSFDASSDQAIVRQACALELKHQFTYLPLFGFILRSTNVRNAFEVFRPLLRLAGDIREPGIAKNARKTELILSSEWDFSPFVYREMPELPGFVMIGIPSPESANPLLVPLAGHELGHSIWRKDSPPLQATWEPKVRMAVIAEIIARWSAFSAAFNLTMSQTQFLTNVGMMRATWFPSLTLAQRQVEETFCDFLGLRIFGWSYLEAFSYLLSPGQPGSRPTIYPPMPDRIDNLIAASASFGVTPSAGYRDRFNPSAPLVLPPSEAMQLEIADAARQRLIAGLIAEAQGVFTASSVTPCTDGERDLIYERYKLVVPREKCKGIPDILNAAWKAYRDDSLWQDNPQISQKKDLVLKELVLKNLELFEIEQILQETP